MQISFVMLIVLLFSDQISGGATVSGGGGAGCLWKKASKVVYGIRIVRFLLVIKQSTKIVCQTQKKMTAGYLGYITTINP